MGTKAMYIRPRARIIGLSAAMKQRTVLAVVWSVRENKAETKTDPAMDSNKISRKKLCASSVLCALSSFTFGVNLTILECVRDVFRGNAPGSARTKVCFSHTEWALMVPVFIPGALISNLVSPFIKLRQRTCLIMSNAFYMAGTLLLLLAYKNWSIWLARFVVGIGMGLTCVYAPLYLESIAPVHIRGTICSLHQLFVVLGILMGQVLSFYFNSEQSWRVGVGSVLGYIVLHTLSLYAIHNTHEKNEESTCSKSLVSLIQNREARLSLITAVALHAAQQLSCINGIILYSNDMFENAEKKRFYTLMIGLTFAVSTMLSMSFVDKYGRKPLLLLSMLTDIVALMLLCVSGNMLIPVLVFVTGFSFGLGPIVWFISSEIFPDEYKVPGAALASAVNWTLAYVVSSYFSLIGMRYKVICFSLHAFFLVVAFLYTLRFFEETKGKTPAFQKRIR